MTTVKFIRLFVLLACVVVLSGPVSAADQIKVDVKDLITEFDKDPKEAREKYAGKQLSFEISVLTPNHIEDGKRWIIVKGGPTGGKNLPNGIFVKLANHYRATDQLVVSGTLKTIVWTADSKRLMFDPCSVEKEIEVLPPIFAADKFLADYLKAPKKIAQQYEGKKVQLKGTVQFKRGGHDIVLLYTPLLNAKGQIEKDSLGFDRLGRALLTAKFSDDTVSKLNPNRGTGVELEGTVTEMKSGAIIISDCKMIK
jgi:hypothetical protein